MHRARAHCITLQHVGVSLVLMLATGLGACGDSAAPAAATSTVTLTGSAVDAFGTPLVAVDLLAQVWPDPDSAGRRHDYTDSLGNFVLRLGSFGTGSRYPMTPSA